MKRRWRSYPTATTSSAVVSLSLLISFNADINCWLCLPNDSILCHYGSDGETFPSGSTAPGSLRIDFSCISNLYVLITLLFLFVLFFGYVLRCLLSNRFFSSPFPTTHMDSQKALEFQRPFFKQMVVQDPARNINFPSTTPNLFGFTSPAARDWDDQPFPFFEGRPSQMVVEEDEIPEVVDTNL